MPPRQAVTRDSPGEAGRVGSRRASAVDPLAAFVVAVRRLHVDACSDPVARARALAALRQLACALRPSEDQARPDPHAYRTDLLHRDQSGWSLALVVLAPGQVTPPHDHESWGGAATVRGLE